MHPGRIFALAGVAAAFLPSLSSSQDPRSQQYVTESAGGTVVSSGFGACVHTGFWTAEQAVPSCDADAAKRAAAAAPVQTSKPAPPPEPKPAATQQSAQAEVPSPAAGTPDSRALAAAAAAATVPAVVAPVAQPSEPKAQTLEPEKQIEQLQTTALPQAVHFSEDAFFDFNDATLKAKGRALLDKLIAQLGDVQYGDILVVGHTDLIGSAKYNQVLSERRAKAVRNYLVRNEIPAERIRAEGRGKKDPVTTPGECKGPVGPKVIACLQPDRRVDIEVSGTKE
jgi:OOP family OmpA-OmpF porin